MKRRKKIVGVIAIIAVLCTATVVGVAYGEPIKEGFFKYFTDDMDKQELEKGVVEDELNRYEEENITVRGIKTTYDGLEVRNGLTVKYNNGRVDGLSSSAPRRLVEIDEWMPIEYMHKIDDTMFYSVYRLEAKGIEYYMYLFFQDENSNTPEENKEYWSMTDWIYCAAKRLSSEDFKDIGPGSTLEEVNAIDPMTSLYRPEDWDEPLSHRIEIDWENTDWYAEHLDDYDTYTYVPEYQAYHLLTDGILCITYHRDSADEEYVVKSVGLNETFELPVNQYGKTICQKVAPEDYPPASK